MGYRTLRGLEAPTKVVTFERLESAAEDPLVVFAPEQPEWAASRLTDRTALVLCGLVKLA